MINNFQGHYRFLSNFWIEPDGSHVEGEYQARKSDPPTLSVERLLPGQAKRAGKTLILRKDWDQVKLQIMRELVTAKFTHHPSLAHLLLSSGDANIIEGNTWGDQYWGVCQGTGENHLGKILMDIRRQLQQ